MELMGSWRASLGNCCSDIKQRMKFSRTNTNHPCASFRQTSGPTTILQRSFNFTGRLAVICCSSVVLEIG